MQYSVLLTGWASLANAIHQTARSLPIACFGLTLVFDFAYMQTSNLLWLHFSEWLLLAGTLGAAVVVLFGLIDFLVRRVRPTWPTVLAFLVVCVLAIFNNLVHTADGWTAVVPWGITLSALTVLGLIVTAWLGRRGDLHA
jgi:uncharacterized membrane protein